MNPAHAKAAIATNRHLYGGYGTQPSGLPLVLRAPCSPALQSFCVATGEGASELVEAINCTGGTFDVEWIGEASVVEPIFVAGSAVLRISGDGRGTSVVSGLNEVRLFEVISSMLHIQNLRLETGVSSFWGGAMRADSSTINVSDSSFDGSTAGYAGGAIFLTNSSNISGRNVAFSRNVALNHGGAVVTELNSTMFLSGNVTFEANWAGNVAGAARILKRSTLLSEAEVTFMNNTSTLRALFMWEKVPSSA